MVKQRNCHSFFAKINPSACLDTDKHDIKEVISELILQSWKKKIANENKKSWKNLNNVNDVVMTGRCQLGKKITFWNMEDKKVI